MKLYAHQLVAEVLPLLNDHNIHCLPIYERTIVIGKITYADLIAFVNYNGKEGRLSAAKLQFDLKTVLPLVRDMQMKKYTAVSTNRKCDSSRIRSSSAAILMLIFSVVAWLFFERANFIRTTQEKTLAVDSDHVMLTLSNGIQLPLNQNKGGLVIGVAQLTYKDGSILFARNTFEEVMMTISTPKKSIYPIMLADGTKVWLNASSRLQFPSTFSKSKPRKVRVNGEAYFEIAKAYNHTGCVPFIVINDNQMIEVLGTHFNIKAYSNNNVKTTLLEGNLRITPLLQPHLIIGADPAMTDPMILANNRVKKPLTDQSVLLSPNQQATLTAEHLTVKPIYADGAIAWAKTDYSFRNMSLENIMNVVSSWYNVNVVYEKKTAGTILLGGSIQRTDQLSQLLASLELASNLHFKVQGKQVTVIK